VGHPHPQVDPGQPGETLLLYTDGVIELRTTEWAYGEQRLLEVAREHAGDSADGLVDAVLRMAVDAQEGEPRDDIALLCLRRS
jgi:phosphoserine phosphatase RsbU/P